MRTILVCNQKGGVGKSLVADELAFSLERSGVPTSFYDLDSQGGTLHETREAEGAEAAVVDTPGALAAELPQWVSAADVVVIPTRAGARDIEPLVRTRDAALAAGASKVVYVLNGWNRFRAASDFLEWLRALSGGSPVACLPQSEDFVRAGAARQSVVAFRPRGRAAEAAVTMANVVRVEAGLGEEPLPTGRGGAA